MQFQRASIQSKCRWIERPASISHSGSFSKWNSSGIEHAHHIFSIRPSMERKRGEESRRSKTATPTPNDRIDSRRKLCLECLQTTCIMSHFGCQCERRLSIGDDRSSVLSQLHCGMNLGKDDKNQSKSRTASFTLDRKAFQLGFVPP